MSTNIESGIKIISPTQQELLPKEGGRIVALENIRDRWRTWNANNHFLETGLSLLAVVGVAVLIIAGMTDFSGDSNTDQSTKPALTEPQNFPNTNFLKLYSPLH